MDLRDQIKEIVRKMLDEESVSGNIGVGAGPISTPNWVAPKGQKENAATKTAKKQGFTVTKKSMPKHSAMNEEKIKISVPKEVAADLDKNNLTLNDLFKTARKADRAKLKSETEIWIQQTLLPQIKSQAGTKINESIEKIVKSKLLNEVSYGKFKKDISYRSKTEILHKGIKEVKRKIQEIDRIVEYTSRMKQELSEGDAVQYWTRTEAQLHQISEMVNNLNEKINKLK